MTNTVSQDASTWERYAPTRFADIAIADNYTRLDLEDWVRFPTRTGNIILEGGYGCGKTTIAQTIARERLGSSISSVELNGGTWDNKTLERLEGVYNWAAVEGEVPVVIINEVDRLNAKQYDLREFIDRHKNRFLFIMTTNHLGNLDGSVIDRSDVFNIRGFTPSEAVLLAEPLLAKQGVVLKSADLLLLFERRLRTGEKHLSLRQIGRVVDGLVLQAAPPTPPKPTGSHLRVV